MRYVTSAERFGFERGVQQGMQQGMQQGERTLLRHILVHRFGPLPMWVLEWLEGAEPAELEVWAKAIFEATNLESLLGPTSGLTKQ
ncbi:hypothetical protein CCP3SC15_5930003 [Gammaproteobacteria bacterium]